MNLCISSNSCIRISGITISTSCVVYGASYLLLGFMVWLLMNYDKHIPLFEDKNGMILATYSQRSSHAFFNIPLLYADKKIDHVRTVYKVSYISNASHHIFSLITTIIYGCIAFVVFYVNELKEIKENIISNSDSDSD
jgi:hypothetical protein